MKYRIQVALLVMLFISFPHHIGSDCSRDADQYCPTCEGSCGEDSNWHLRKELIYWTTFEDGLAFTNKHSNVLTTDDFTTTHKIHPDFHWEYGFRLGGGYSLPCTNWTCWVAWTNIASKATGQRQGNSGPPEFQGRFPLWSMSPSTLPNDYISKARMRWYLNTNIVDLDAQYKFCWYTLEVKPQFGLRIAIIDQKLHTKYSGGTFFSGSDENIMRNRFFGVGPRLGSGFSYYIWQGISAFGLVAATPMYGFFYDSHRETYLDNNLFSAHRRQNRFAWSFDYQFGFQWKGKIFDFWPLVSAAISWEGHEFFRLNRMQRGNFGFFKRNRNLILNGWTFSASFCF
jgi:hypothetical protein